MCDICGCEIPEEFSGEDALACCGWEFCSYKCMRLHTEGGEAA